MGLNPATFLSRLQYVVTGSGFKRVIQGVNLNTLRDDAGVILTGATEPSREALETTFDGVVVSSSQTDLGYLTFQIPRDYDESIDKLHFRFLCNSAGDTNTPTLDAALIRKRAGAAVATVQMSASAAVNTNTAKADWVEIVSEGGGHKAGDAVCVSFATSAHTTDALNVYGLEVVYASDLVYYEDAERSISDE